MYNGTNPTALRSQEMFIDALSRLMERKAFSDISVKELCLEADLSRQTFYLLFCTKENILTLHFERVFEKYAGIIRKDPSLTTHKVADWFIQFLRSEKKFIVQLVDNGLTPIMLRQFRIYLKEVDDMLLKGERLLQNYAIAFLAGALAEVAAEYVKDSDPPHDEQVSELICMVLKGEYFNIEGGA